jgi:hypothetical protein
MVNICNIRICLGFGIRVLGFGFLILEFVWNLEFGAWNLPDIYMDFLMINRSSMKITLFVLLFGFIISYAHGQTILSSGDLKVILDEKGYFKELTEISSGENYLYRDTIAPSITIIAGKNRFLPDKLTYDETTHLISVSFNEDEIGVDVLVSFRDDYLTFEVVKAEPADLIDGLVWGPVPTNISRIVGEIIGVVRDDEVALGLQVLNPKTLGGYYNPEGMTWNRGEAAVKKAFGSLLQAYSINRDKFRHVDTWGGEYKNTPVAPLKGETVVGSKIALFLCKETEALNFIGQIELAEHLPHPTIEGKWIKTELQRGRSYLIADFKEGEIDEMIGYTKRAGLISLYHEGPFLNWGHYDLNPEYFPNGKEGMKECARKAEKAGLFFGVHTLTNFITTNDPYVTPVPDHRLALTGYGFLTEDIGNENTEIAVSTKEYFEKQENNWLHTVRIGDELIRYKAVTDSEPYRLLDCQRGAFGTTPAPHMKNDTVGKLYDHAYEVFFPNLDLQREIAVNLAQFFNETGISHLDFDGHEGCLASGQGDYAINLFAQDFYDNLDHEVLNGTSLSKTYYWHINTFCNWGEPWYGGFKESMQEYRISNQALFDRNFVPHMLGWYLLTQNTILIEMEWMLARAAGYDAGFAMVARPNSIRGNPIGGELLDAIREWETARLSGAFSEQQKERLKNPANEFHLENTGKSEWKLYQYQVDGSFIYHKQELQPGQPAYDRWDFKRQSFEQPLQFKMDVTGNSGSVQHIKIVLDNYFEINIEQELLAGETVICDGTSVLRVYDQKGKLKNMIGMPSGVPVMSIGSHQVRFSCDFSGDPAPDVRFVIKSLGNPESIKPSVH